MAEIELKKVVEEEKNKVVILFEDDLDVDEFKCIYSVTGDVVTVNPFLLNKSLAELLSYSTFVLIDIRVKKNRLWYMNNCKVLKEMKNVIIVKKSVKGMPIDKMKEQKEVIGGFVLKYLPPDSKTIKQYVESINDHISSSLILSPTKPYYILKKLI